MELSRADDKLLSIATYIESKDRTIFALSDIHADIHSLIIALEDLAQVIENVESSKSLEELLQMDISSDANDIIYNDYVNLNYKWKDNNNSYIVIVGDIIDGVRPLVELDDRAFLLENGKYEHEYPQIEIKILKFINALNMQASRYKGYIFKLFGNHEIGNILDRNIYTNYNFPTDKIGRYYNDTTRKDIFKRNNIGYELLTE